MAWGDRERARRMRQLAAGQIRFHAWNPSPELTAARERNLATAAAAEKRRREQRPEPVMVPPQPAVMVIDR